MPVLKVTTDDFTLNSGWKCTWVANGQFVLPKGQPTWAMKNVIFEYSLPSGAKITKVQVWATLGSPSTGCAVLNANGHKFTETSGTEKGANIISHGNTGKMEVWFNYKANGNKKDTQQHWAPMTFKNVYLLIEYEEAETEPGTKPPKLTGMQIPPQSCCIYDQENGNIYLFDGVTKIQHALTMKIEEEPEKNKDQYVNNARNEPDKLTLDVVMSDVYDSARDGAITKARGFTDAERAAFDSTSGSLLGRNNSEAFTRSENAFCVLRDLKEARRKLSVITPQFVHTDMIIASVTVNQDEEHPYGWEGQIVFQHAFPPKPVQKTYSQKKDNKDTPPTQSTGFFSGLIKNLFGK